MSIKVTIGVCTKNSERTIKESIESIINQKYPAELMQIIVVDGCSSDKTMSIIASITAKAGVKVETYSDNGAGLGTARQIVVNNAEGKYVIFIDGDVSVFSDFVENHVKFMEANPAIGVAFGTPVFKQGTLNATVKDLSSTAAGGGVGNDATIYRFEAMRQVGGFDTKIKGAAEDQDLLIRFRLFGWQASVNEKARFFHNRRVNLRSFWFEQSWFGYGDHYVNHKHDTMDTVWRKVLAVEFVYTLKLASSAYKRSHLKLSFLIPLQLALGNIAWWFGFIKGHIDGYGHGKSV